MIPITRLVISRKTNESFTIGDDIAIKIGEIKGNQIRVIIDAPENISIQRDNIKNAIHKDNKCFMKDQASRRGFYENRK